MQAPPEPDAPLSRSARRNGDPGRAKAAAFELKGMVAPLTVLRLRSTDVGLIERQLRLKVAEMPQFFQDAPVLLDLGALGPSAAELAFVDLAHALRGCTMVPVAVTQAEEDARRRAAAAGFGYVSPPAARASGRGVAGTGTPAPTAAQPAATQPAPEAPPLAAPGGAVAPTATQAPAAEPAPRGERSETPVPRSVTHRPPVVVRQPVRSGQIIYAEATDLVILAPVNPGAEVIADGHVHIYAPLRGRAVAGAQGMTEARIFCQKLEAELVAISGAYLLNDDLPADRRGKAAQIHLEDGVCRVLPLS